MLIHIGQAKTGTTTLQNTLWRSSEALRAQGVYFPRVGRLQGSAMILGHHLLNDQTDDPIRRTFLGMDNAQAQVAARRYWREIAKEVASSEIHKLLISSEHFFYPHSAKNISKLNRETGAVAERGHIIAYLRSPAAYELSWIQQNLKQVRTWTPGARDHLKTIIQPIMEHWHGELSLNLFDTHTMIAGDIVPDFMAKYCPEVDLATLDRKTKRVNTSMSAEAMALLQDLRAGRIAWTRDPMALILEIRRMDQRIPEPNKPRLTSQAERNFINWRAPDLFWLRERHGLVFSDINYAEIAPEAANGRALYFDAIEQICTVNAERKAELLAQARRRAVRPAFLRRWLAKH